MDPQQLQQRLAQDIAAAPDLSALDAVRGRLAWGERLGVVFTGLSLGSVLLLVALGLAITYGLMGVINMAHGELMMIGAYTTYVIQNLFRAYLPGLFDGYVLVAIPAAFVVAAAVAWIVHGKQKETEAALRDRSDALLQASRERDATKKALAETERALTRAEGLRQQAQAPPEPRRGGILGFFGF